MPVNISTLLHDDKKESTHRNATQLSIEEDEEKTSRSEKWYLCRQCHNRITNLDARVSIHGKHIHAFANPNGIIFEIACFSTAQGFSLSGKPSYEFTWFTGYSWQITICANCLAHLGWFFQNQMNAVFIGLITDRIFLDSSSN